MTTGTRDKNLARMRRRALQVTGQPAQACADCVARPPVVILFSDDSTLIFACRMRDALLHADPACPIIMAWFRDENALSYRQVSQLLPQGPDQILNGKDLSALMKKTTLAAIVTSRVYRAMFGQLKDTFSRWSGNRPCIISFLGGLDFFPEQGFVRRRNCDAVYLFPEHALEDYRTHTAHLVEGWQELGFGHPSVLTPQQPPKDLAQRRDIYFFAQALSPSTKRGRLHLLRAMAAVARANPDRRVFIKLRHLPHENQQHLHLERYHYSGLMAALTSPPPNLLLTDISMEEALKTASLGITCTSTAAMDVVGAGLPCMVYLEYVDAYCDPLAEPMRGLFQHSNLITPLERLLKLEHGTPDAAWMQNLFCPRDLGARVLRTIERFHARPFQINPPDTESQI